MNPLAKIWNWFRGLFNRYEGAVYSPTRSTIPGPLTSSRFVDTPSSRQELARKLQWFERNSELVQALAGKFENFVVGAAPQLTPTSSDPEWNKAAKAWWEEWSLVCDIASRQSFGCILNLLARRWFIDGDIFILLTKGSDFTSGGSVRQFPRIQVIEGHLCKTPPQFKDDPRVIDGVRVDERGRPVGYYFAEEPKSGEFIYPPMVEAENVLHLFEPSRPGQTRGFSFFHASVNTLHDIQDLDRLEMQAAKENASTTVWIKTETGELDPATLRRNAFTETSKTNTGTQYTENKVDYYRDISGGRARMLKRGDEVMQNGGERPSVTTVQFWKYKLETVCSGVEIPYCIIFPDTMQGTMYRGALDMATAFFRSRHAVIADLQRRIWAYVMRFAIQIDRRLADPPEDWRSVSILPPRAPNVDIGRNTTAEGEQLLDGRTNLDILYAQQGKDWRQELKKRNEELEFIEAECPALARQMAAQNPPPAQNGPVPIRHNEMTADE